jgi:hypothetical protein
VHTAHAHNIHPMSTPLSRSSTSTAPRLQAFDLKEADAGPAYQVLRIRQLEMDCIAQTIAIVQTKDDTCYKLVEGTLDHVKVRYAPESSDSLR